MNRESVYIIGRVGDVTDETYYEYVCRKFAIRATSLKRMGYAPVNPMQLVPRESSWHEAMSICIPAMLACKHISPLPDTWVSKGGMIEFDLVRTVGKTIVIPTIENEIEKYENNF